MWLEQSVMSAGIGGLVGVLLVGVVTTAIRMVLHANAQLKTQDNLALYNNFRVLFNVGIR